MDNTIPFPTQPRLISDTPYTRACLVIQYQADAAKSMQSALAEKDRLISTLMLAINNGTDRQAVRDAEYAHMAATKKFRGHESLAAGHLMDAEPHIRALSLLEPTT